MLVSYLLLAVVAGLSSVWLWGMVNRSYEGWQASSSLMSGKCPLSDLQQWHSRRGAPSLLRLPLVAF